MRPLILIDDLFLWLPLKGLVAVIDQIQQRVGEADPSTPAQLRKRLLEVRLRYEMDEIEEEEYEETVALILERLRNLSGTAGREDDQYGPEQ